MLRGGTNCHRVSVSPHSIGGSQPGAEAGRRALEWLGKVRELIGSGYPRILYPVHYEARRKFHARFFCARARNCQKYNEMDELWTKKNCGILRANRDPVDKQLRTGIRKFQLHARAIGKLGPLEWVLNTPSHHPVHHARNPRYLDRNYAGTLIISVFGMWLFLLKNRGQFDGAPQAPSRVVAR
jgi:hypothetical protein